MFFHSWSQICFVHISLPFSKACQASLKDLLYWFISPSQVSTWLSARLLQEVHVLNLFLVCIHLNFIHFSWIISFFFQILCDCSPFEEEDHRCHLHLRPLWDLAALLWLGGPRRVSHLPRRVQRGGLHHLWGVLVGSRERKTGLCVQHSVNHIRASTVRCLCLLPLHHRQTKEMRCPWQQDTRSGRHPPGSQEEDLQIGCPSGDRLRCVLASNPCVQRAEGHRHPPH